MTHELKNIAAESDTQPICPDFTKFVKDNIAYFGLYKTDKTGLYAIGRVNDQNAPVALILAKRFNTTDYSLHKPLAATSSGYNFYGSYIDNGTNTMMKLEGNNSPTRSSNATYESIWIDCGTPEYNKTFEGVVVSSQVIPASCNIKVDARTDNASSYDTNSLQTLDNTVDQHTNPTTTSGTYWYREWKSLVGRVIQIRVRCTSSGTSTPIIYLISFLSRTLPLV